MKKQAVVINSTIEMSKGKTAAQASHASLEAFLKAEEDIREAWRTEGGKKIVLQASRDEMDELRADAESLNIPCYEVCDAGLTEVEPGTVTALGLGPAEEDKIDEVTGELELVK